MGRSFPEECFSLIICLVVQITLATDKPPLSKLKLNNYYNNMKHFTIK